MGIQLIEVAGSPRERGRAHGEALRDSIRHSLGWYFAAMGRSDGELSQVGEEVRAGVRDVFPDLANEIDAIAEGVGVEPWRLHVLNARSELMSGMADGCTAVYAPEARVLGQTWDWAEPLEDLVVVLKVEREDGHRILTVTEPGMVGKIGFNSVGVGVCLNFLFLSGRLSGTPVHVLLRAVMEAGSFEAARRSIDRSTPGQSGNLLLGSAEGPGLDVELAGDARFYHAIDDTAFAHTNHHFWHDIDAGVVGPSSNARLDAAQAWLDTRGVKDFEGLRGLLSDQSHDTFPICSPYLDAMSGLRLGTICTVLMDLPARRMEVRKSPDPNAPFETFAL